MGKKLKKINVCTSRTPGIKLDPFVSQMLEIIYEVIIEDFNKQKSDYCISFWMSYSGLEFRNFKEISVAIGRNANIDWCDDWIQACVGIKNRSDEEIGISFIVFGDRFSYHFNFGVVHDGDKIVPDYNDKLVDLIAKALKKKGYSIE